MRVVWIRRALQAAAGLQAATGLALTGTCLCAPTFRRTGALVAFGAALTVLAFAALGYFAVTPRRARRCAVAAAFLEALLLPLIPHQSVTPSLWAWGLQIPVLALVVFALVSAFSRRVGD